MRLSARSSSRVRLFRGSYAIEKEWRRTETRAFDNLELFFCRANEELSAPGDPLEWFGTLVSPNLRQSQQDFTAGKCLLQASIQFQGISPRSLLLFLDSIFIAALQVIAELANARNQIIKNLSVLEQKQLTVNK